MPYVLGAMLAAGDTVRKILLSPWMTTTQEEIDTLFIKEQYD